MSKHKAGGSKASQHVSPAGKRLGIKRNDGQSVSVGEVLVRQRGTRFAAGDGVSVGRDHTLYSIISGKLKFSLKKGKKTVSVNS